MDSAVKWVRRKHSILEQNAVPPPKARPNPQEIQSTQELLEVFLGLPQSDLKVTQEVTLDPKRPF